MIDVLSSLTSDYSNVLSEILQGVSHAKTIRAAACYLMLSVIRNTATIIDKSK